jgi:hypothetical protein
MELFTHLNYLAVIVATAVYFAIGAVWYTPLFGKAWQKETGVKMTSSGKFPLGKFLFGMGGQLVSSFFFTFGIALLIIVMNKPGWLAGLGTALTVSVFFAFPVNSGKLFFQNKPKLFWIDFGYNCVGAVIVGVILALWR